MFPSVCFVCFLANWHISNNTGVPYNPQGQAIVKYKNHTLKLYLSKHKGRVYTTPTKQLTMALYAINYEILDKQGCSAAQQQWVRANSALNVFGGKI